MLATVPPRCRRRQGLLRSAPATVAAHVGIPGRAYLSVPVPSVEAGVSRRLVRLELNPTAMTVTAIATAPRRPSPRAPARHVDRAPPGSVRRLPMEPGKGAGAPAARDACDLKVISRRGIDRRCARGAPAGRARRTTDSRSTSTRTRTRSPPRPLPLRASSSMCRRGPVSRKIDQADRDHATRLRPGRRS